MAEVEALAPEQQRLVLLARARLRLKQRQQADPATAQKPSEEMTADEMAASGEVPVPTTGPGTKETPEQSRRSLGREIMRNVEVGLLGMGGVGALGIKSAQLAGRLPSHVAQVTQKAPGVARAIAEELGKFIVTKPKTAVALEAAAGTTAAIGGEIAAETSGTEAARPMGEIAGGFGVPAVGVAAAKTAVGLGRLSVWLAEKTPVVGSILAPAIRTIRGQLTSGARVRAEEHLRGAVENPEAAAARIGGEAGTIPEAKLTPAQRTGEEGLLAIEKAVIESSAHLKGESARQFADVNAAIRASLRGVADERATKAILADPKADIASHNYLMDLLDARVAIAQQRATERLASMGAPNREVINRVAREELESALSSANKQERELWNQVPRSTKVDATASKKAVADLVKQTPRAQQDQIPERARVLLAKGKGALPNQASIHELQGLRSRLLEDARIASAAGKFNEARINNEIADVLLRDMSGSTPTAAKATADASPDFTGPAGWTEHGRALRAAMDFTRGKHELFSSDPLSRVLGTQRAGGERVASGLTLETTVGVGGPKGRENADALLATAKAHGNEAATRGTVTEFLKAEFLRTATRDGAVTPGGSRTFFKKYDETLKRFPEVRQSLAETTRLGLVVAPRKQVTDILGSANPRGAMEQAMSGTDAKSLKAAMVDRLVTGAEMGATDAVNREFVSGRKMIAQLQDPKFRAAASRLFSPEEMTRLEQIATTAARVESALKTTPAKEIIRTAPSAIIEIIARVVGARAGAQIGGGTAGGGLQSAAILSAKARALVTKSVKDPAERLIIDAVQNPRLFEALLTRTSVPEQRQQAVRIINAWAADVAGESITESD